jgi:NAD(P)-dependent dehydrogenase (short-subunit alcohol dehydrogenase family)
MMKEFAGKVAVITGAASGIGRALTEKCLNEGMQVVMADIEEQVLFDAAEQLRSQGHNSILTVPTNVAILEQIEALCQKTIDQFGEVHLLFNNAGVGGGGNSWQATRRLGVGNGCQSVECHPRPQSFCSADDQPGRPLPHRQYGLGRWPA